MHQLPFLIMIYVHVHIIRGFPTGSVVNSYAGVVGDANLTPGLARSPEEKHGNPFQYSAYWAIAHRMAKSQT